ncbi:hypothetical protein M595_0616 [Lyngbya aestuarii BL J]|uniref:Uncharacterized protein n=1 Tax=Lyngbya aestuarii BL J TaxID=1348334 RepID=U7QQR3_9CYAN|nr:hypothetical protein M595_0616 [Lyngbya aestuarii BL J]
MSLFTQKVGSLFGFLIRQIGKWGEDSTHSKTLPDRNN